MAGADPLFQERHVTVAVAVACAAAHRCLLLAGGAAIMCTARAEGDARISAASTAFWQHHWHVLSRVLRALPIDPALRLLLVHEVVAKMAKEGYLFLQLQGECRHEVGLQHMLACGTALPAPALDVLESGPVCRQHDLGRVVEINARAAVAKQEAEAVLARVVNVPHHPDTGPRLRLLLVRGSVLTIVLRRCEWGVGCPRPCPRHQPREALVEHFVHCLESVNGSVAVLGGALPDRCRVHGAEGDAP